jgi:hypothetical protein
MPFRLHTTRSIRPGKSSNGEGISEQILNAVYSKILDLVSPHDQVSSQCERRRTQWLHSKAHLEFRLSLYLDDLVQDHLRIHVCSKRVLHATLQHASVAIDTKSMLRSMHNFDRLVGQCLALVL